MRSTRIDNLIHKFKSEFKILRSKGFISFVLSTTISRAISFISIIFLARILSKDDYGLLSYIDNIRNYVLIINGLGLSNVILRYCAQTKDESKSLGYFYVSLVVGLTFDLLIILVSIIFFLNLSFDFPTANNYLIFLSLLPLFIYIIESFQMYFRATFKNNLFSISTLVYSFLMIAVQVILGMYFGLIGIVIGRYFAVIITIILTTVLFFINYKDKFKILLPNRIETKSMIFLGLAFLVAGASSTMITYNEISIISNTVLDTVRLADYKASTLILQITYFFINSIVLFSFPYFVKNKEDKKWVKEKFDKMLIYLASFMIPLHIVLYFVMDYVIILVFGIEYISAIPLAKLILITSLIQTLFRMPLGNLMVAIGKEKSNVIVNVTSLIIHFILTFYMTKLYSIEGAMISTMIIYAASSFVMYIIYCKFVKIKVIHSLN